MTCAVVKSYFYVAQLYDVEGSTGTVLDLVVVLRVVLTKEGREGILFENSISSNM